MRFPWVDGQRRGRGDGGELQWRNALLFPVASLFLWYSALPIVLPCTFSNYPTPLVRRCSWCMYPAGWFTPRQSLPPARCTSARGLRRASRLSVAATCAAAMVAPVPSRHRRCPLFDSRGYPSRCTCVSFRVPRGLRHLCGIARHPRSHQQVLPAPPRGGRVEGGRAQRRSGAVPHCTPWNRRAKSGGPSVPTGRAS